MSWKLFIDDIRKEDDGYTLCKSMEEAVSLIEEKGFPSAISFDHDLGDNVPTGKDFANLICDKVLDKDWIIPDDFTFSVHSDNSVGAENIRSLLNNFLSHIGHSFQLKRCEPYSHRK